MPPLVGTVCTAWLLLPRLKVAHAIAIDQVNQRRLSSDDGEMGMRSGLVGKQHRSSGAEVVVFGIQLVGIEWRKVIGNSQGAPIEVELEQGVSIIAAAPRNIETAIARGGVNVAGAVGGNAGVAGPDAAVIGVGRNIDHSLLLQGLRIVSHDPSVIRPHIARGCPRKIDVAVRQQKSGARILAQRVEGHHAAGGSITLAGYRPVDFNRAAEFFDSVGDCQRVELLVVFAG